MDNITISIYVSNLSIVRMRTILGKAHNLSENELDKLKLKDFDFEMNQVSFMYEKSMINNAQINIPINTFIRFFKLWKRLSIKEHEKTQ